MDTSSFLRRAATLFSLVFLSACAGGEAVTTVVDPYVDDVVSVGWLQGGGVYRVIERNTEEDPCLTAESIKYGGDPPRTMVSSRLCAMRVGEKTYDLTDTAAISYHDIRWENGAFHLRVELDPRQGPPELHFACVIAGIEHKPMMTCE
jgi:hypothetical protein